MQEKITGIITDIKKFATHDGPGIRTTVFLKGCFLRCQWCANPETIDPQPQLYFISKKCKQEGRCIQACPKQAISRDEHQKVDRNKCSLCFECTDACLQGALQPIGRKVTVQEVLLDVAKDLPFYGDDGGVTLSGGEPFFQPQFTLQLLESCRQRGISTVVDTTGYTNQAVLQEAIQYTDLFLLDIKHMNDQKHQAGTGVSNKPILRNARIMADKGKVRISLPLVPGYNNSIENLQATAQFARDIGVEWIDINPLHTLGTSKYHYLGMLQPYQYFNQISKEVVKEAKDLLQAYGLKTTIGRMM